MDMARQVEQYARSRDARLREQIVVAYSPLIRKIASEFISQGVPMDDLIQVGYLGLLAAIEAYDPNRGVNFAVYARPLIRGQMRHYLRDSRDTIRKPRWLHKANQQIEWTMGRYLSEEGRFPTLEELASELNVTEQGLMEILKTREAVRTIPLEAGEQDDDPEVDQRLIRHKSYMSFQLPIEDRIVLHEAFEKLSSLQRQVLYQLFFRDVSQPSAARSLGVSQKQVSRVLATALTKLRELIIRM